MNKITICMGSSCFSRGNRRNLERIESFLRTHHLEAQVSLVGSRCEKHCAEGPIITIDDTRFIVPDQETLLFTLRQHCQKQQTPSD